MDNDDKQESEKPDDISDEVDDEDVPHSENDAEEEESAPQEDTQQKGKLTSALVKEITAPATVALKKLSLSKAERIALGSLVIISIGLMIWGFIWLSSQNEIANKGGNIELPAEGKHATVSDLSTFWITAERKSGVNSNAALLPSATITLDSANSGDGALLLRFKNSEGTIIGDNISLSFKNGKFSNDSDTIEVSATDGLRDENLFYAYQVGEVAPWRLVVQEAPSKPASESDYTELISVPVSAIRK